ncbi:MAG: hypothetical protein K2H17_08525, partial [Duncaniella sp.]|uniref:hypothetical protein n=1 Tax=Duncaniella sp. TaxID=2518496 RepID=UPI0023CDEEBA
SFLIYNNLSKRYTTQIFTLVFKQPLTLIPRKSALKIIDELKKLRKFACRLFAESRSWVMRVGGCLLSERCRSG